MIVVTFLMIVVIEENISFAAMQCKSWVQVMFYLNSTPGLKIPHFYWAQGTYLCSTAWEMYQDIRNRQTLTWKNGKLLRAKPADAAGPHPQSIHNSQLLQRAKHI